VGEIIQNVLMTVLLFPLSMLLIGIYARLYGPFERKFYWMVVGFAYLVMLFVCWGVETGFLYNMVQN
jgi:hypothetical protein